MRSYDLAVVGGGSAGLTAAVGAAHQGARTILIERDRTGGDCLWTGCVPSKTLISAAARARVARAGAAPDDTPPVDFAAVIRRVRAVVSELAEHDSPTRLRAEGVEVVHGHARFTGPQSLHVDGREVRFRHAMLATGARPAIPPIPGLRESSPLTSETLWELNELPQRLVVLGGGPIGVELGQAFARLGSRVSVVEMADGLVPHEEPAAQAAVAAALAADGVDVRLATRGVRVEAGRLVVEHDGVTDEVAYDALLVASGRRPSVDGLGLDEAGVRLGEGGEVAVDGQLRTSNPRIFAGGDVTALLPFTHTASAHGATVVQNALFGLRRTVDHERIPWVTFTAPEVARVGLTAGQARERFGARARVRTVAHTGLDRAVAAGETGGFTSLIGDHRGRLVGATVVGPRAGETIGEVVAWMAAGARVSRIAQSTHAYPTWNASLANASLEELQATLRRIRPATRLALAARRLVWR